MQRINCRSFPVISHHSQSCNAKTTQEGSLQLLPLVFRTFAEAQGRWSLCLHSRKGAQVAARRSTHGRPWDYSRNYGTSACSSRNRPASPCALVRLGLTGLECNPRPPRPADAAHYFARLRDRNRAASLATVPAHGGRNPTRSSSRRRTRAWTVPRARARCHCLPRPAGVARRWSYSVCLRGDSGCLFEALSASPRGRYVVICACW